MISVSCYYRYITNIRTILILVIYLYLQSSENYEYQISEKQTTDVASVKSTWVILGFADIRYLLVAKMWYDRLSALGYEDHVIMALDVSLYENLIKKNYRCEIAADTIKGEISDIWKLRFEVRLKYLRRGINVFVTDVDSFWNFYFSLDQLPKEYDSFQAFATTWPNNIFKKWGFTLCGCIAGYGANVKTVSLLQRLLTQCGKLRHHCDDQIVLNEMYTFSYNMKWINNTGFSIQYNYRISVFKKMFVSRANLNCESCISMDLSRKKIEAKLKYGNHIMTCVVLIICLSNLEIYAEVYIFVDG